MFDSFWKKNKLYIGNDENEIFIKCDILDGMQIAVDNNIKFEYDLNGVDKNELLTSLDDYFPIDNDYLSRVMHRWNYICDKMCNYKPFNDDTGIQLISIILNALYELLIDGDYEVDDITESDLDGYIIFVLEKSLMNNRTNKLASNFGKMIHHMEMYQIEEIFNYR
jgi:hypothetical protein